MTDEETPRVVPDTGVLLRASINANNVSSSLLRRVEAGEVLLCVSMALLTEIRDVLTRPEIRAKNARLDDAALEAYVTQIQTKAILIDPLPSHMHYERDPDDEHILNLAIESHAAYIVTFDNDLLDLMKTSGKAALAFQQSYPTITILTPGELITRLNMLRQPTDAEVATTVALELKQEQTENG